MCLLQNSPHYSKKAGKKTRSQRSSHFAKILKKLLVATIHKTNVKNPSNFSTISHFDVEEPETCKQAINGPYA